MTDKEMLDAIRHIVAVHEFHVEDDEGDKHLSSNGYAMEAISAVINGVTYGPVREFMTAEI